MVLSRGELLADIAGRCDRVLMEIRSITELVEQQASIPDHSYDQEVLHMSDPEDWRCSRCTGRMSQFPAEGWFHRCTQRHREG